MSPGAVIESIFYFSAGLLLYVYLLYPLVLALLPPFRASSKENDKKKMTRWPSVSVIVAAYNEESTIADKIRNFLEGNYPGPSEIVIVSDGSTDATADVVKRMSNDRVRLIVQQPRQGKGAALNRAVPRARGEILVFTDATSMFVPETLRELVRPFANSKVGLVNGRIHYRGSALANLYHRYERLLTGLEVRGGVIATAHGAIYALRKRLWRPHDPRMVNDFLHPMVVNLQGCGVTIAPKALCLEQFSSGAQFDRQARMVALAALVYFKLLPQLLRARLWRSMFVLTSHKLLRWLAALWLLILALTTPWLARNGGVYGLALDAEALFVVLAGVGLLAKTIGWSGRTALFYHFLAINFAALIGLWLCFRGRVSAVWEPNGGYSRGRLPEQASPESTAQLAARVPALQRVAGERR